MYLYPMSFMEFLKASGENLLAEKLGHIKSANPLPEIVHSKLTDLLKMYLYLGGMPEVVANYLENSGECFNEFCKKLISCKMKIPLFAPEVDNIIENIKWETAPKNSDKSQPLLYQ